MYIYKKRMYREESIYNFIIFHIDGSIVAITIGEQNAIKIVNALNGVS